MDKNDFIQKMKTASGTLDEARLSDTAEGCIERCHDMRPDLPKGYLNVIGLLEECGELTTAVCQRTRGRTDGNFDVLQEMADVILDIVCVAKVLNVTDDQLIRAVNVKVDREADRVLEHRLGHQSK